MPRKSDGPRRNDTSTARFILADDEASHKSPPTLQPIAPQPIAPAPTSSTTTKEKEKEVAGIKESKDSIAIEDLNLPKSIITRLAKGVLPPNTQVQANAILALSKSATLFVNYLASHANDNTMAANKKTIMPGDVFKALDDTEFGFMRAKLEAEFAKFHETNSAKRSNYRKKVAAAKKSGGGSSADVSMADSSTLMHDDGTMLSAGGAAADQPSASKKARIIPRDAPNRMDVDHDEISDADTVPDEPHDEDEDEEDDEVEEEEEEEEEDEEDEDQVDEEDDDEDLDEEQREAREKRRNYDEALDDEDEDEDL